MELQIFLVATVGLIIYFLPALVASGRKHPNSTAIFVLNLLIGWTVLGWIGAMVWAFTTSRAREAPA